MNRGFGEYFFKRHSQASLTSCSVVDRWCNDLGDLSKKNLTLSYRGGTFDQDIELRSTYRFYVWQFRWQHEYDACLKEVWKGFHKDQCVYAFASFANDHHCEVEILQVLKIELTII